MPASGSFGFGDTKAAGSFDLNKLGAIVLKTTTPQAKLGNPQPQIAVLDNGVLNSVGLTNPGVDAVIKEKLPAFRARFPTLPVIASVAGESIHDYALVAHKLALTQLVSALELNVSCPNVSSGGMQFGVSPQAIKDLTKMVKDNVDIPVYVKLTPNVTDISACAKAAQAGGADGLTMINTLAGMHIDPFTRRPVLGNKTGGWSGPGIKPSAIRMIYQAAHAVDLPIIGVGGITSALDVIEMFLAGASAVQIGTAQFSDPMACLNIVQDLTKELDKLHITTLSKLRRAVKRRFKNER